MSPHIDNGKRWFRLWAMVILLGSVVVFGSVVGCGPQIPPCFKVTGKVVSNKPLSEGSSITFISTKDPEQRATGFIGSDGTFSLTTRMLGDNKEGAPEGEYTIFVDDPASNVGQDGQLQMKPILSKQEKYTVEAKDNNFTVEITKT